MWDPRIRDYGKHYTNNLILLFIIPTFVQRKRGRTMKMFASTAVRLSVPCIETIGKIMNSEEPDLCTGKTEFENRGATKKVYALGWLSVILKFHSASIYFPMHCIHEQEVLYRNLCPSQHSLSSSAKCKENSFRTVQDGDVTTQLKASVEALKEKYKFLKYICRSR